MNRKLSSVLRLCVTIALILASYLIAARPSLENPQTGKSAAAKAAGKTSLAGTAPTLSQRNIGKAYYEQGNTLRPSGSSRR